MHRLILCLALAATPALAGGPVIIEDAAESAPVVRNRNDALFILLGLAVAAVILGSGSDTCNSEETGGGKC